MTQIRSLLWRPSVRAALPIFILMRVITAVAAFWISTYYAPTIDWANQPIYNLHEVAFTTPPPLRSWLEPWYRWDTGWYVHIAYEGYSTLDGSIIFAPLYPFTMKVLAPLLGGDYLLAGLVVSNLCCFLMLVLFYELVAREFGADKAQLTLWLYMVYPASFYFFAAYTESLFMVLVLGAWLAVQDRRYVLGGLLALLSSLTRSQGWTLALPFALIAFIEQAPNVSRNWTGLQQLIRYHLQQPVATLRRAFAVIGGVIGTLVYFEGIRLAQLGDVAAEYEGPWRTQIRMPWESVAHIVDGVIGGKLNNFDVANLLAFFFVLLVILLAIRQLRPAYWLYVLGSLVYILMRNYDLYYLHGMVRYAVHLFPAFIALALLLSNKRLLTLFFIALAVGLQVWLVTLFAAWNWVS
ncbi:MAG: hypothetical protein KF726_02335 [Anaerolineae bacterium]|nr:hypothetical protein [Anaerolineae bacterium]